MIDPEQYTWSGPAGAFLDAVTEISSDLDLRGVLARVVESATVLTGAAYGALGVLDSRGETVDLVITGIDGRNRAQVDELTARRGIPVQTRGTPFGFIYLSDKAGGAPLDGADRALVQALAAAAGFVIDDARAYGLSERRRQWLEAAAELTELLQPPIDLLRARQHIAKAARSVSGSLTAAMISVPERQVPDVIAVDGPAQHLGPALLAAIGAELRSERDGPMTLDVTLGDDLAVVVPLRAHLADTGALVAVYGAGYRCDDVEERELLASFADQAALALDRAQALVERQDLALVTDRERIARDLHDVVIQRLFATGLQLQVLRSSVSEPAVVARIIAMIDDLDHTIREVRSTIFELQDRVLGSRVV